MGLRICCDRCGVMVTREDACAMVLVKRAFAKGNGGEKEQFELCPDCRRYIADMLNGKEDTNGV